MKKNYVMILLVALGCSLLLSSCYYERFGHGYRGYGGYGGGYHHHHDGGGYGYRGYEHHRY